MEWDMELLKVELHFPLRAVVNSEPPVPGNLTYCVLEQHLALQYLLKPATGSALTWQLPQSWVLSSLLAATVYLPQPRPQTTVNCELPLSSVTPDFWHTLGHVV